MDRRALPAVLLALLLVTAGCVSLGPAEEGAGGTDADGRPATVVDVVDGDTVEVEFRDGSRETVRILGVDTPEVHVPNDPAEFGYENTSATREWLRERGHRASAFAREELAGADVTVVFDPETDRRDTYGRLLAYVEYDGGDFGENLLSGGHARLYDTAFERRDAYAAAAERARADGDGVWGYGPRAGNVGVLFTPAH